MANNRVFIECVGCEHEKPSYFGLAKRMMDGYYIGARRETIASDLSQWFDEHKFCGDTQDHFRLHYECRPDSSLVEQTEIDDYTIIDVEPKPRRWEEPPK